MSKEIQEGVSNKTKVAFIIVISLILGLSITVMALVISKAVSDKEIKEVTENNVFATDCCKDYNEIMKLTKLYTVCDQQSYIDARNSMKMTSSLQSRYFGGENYRGATYKVAPLGFINNIMCEPTGANNKQYIVSLTVKYDTTIETYVLKVGYENGYLSSIEEM